MSEAITPAGEIRQAVALMRADASPAGTVTGTWTPEAARAVADLLAIIAFLVEQDFAQAGPAARALIAARAYMGAGNGQ